MRIHPILLSICGVALAAGSIVLSDGLLNPQPTAASTNTIVVEQETVILIAAAVDIPFGAEITEADLTAQSWPVAALPEGYFDSSAVLFGPDGTPPRRATEHIRAGELLLATNVSNFGEQITITYNLSADTRAMAIEVNAATAVGGFVAPGDSVDIVLTQGRNETLRTGTILQNIRVLGIDQDADMSQSAAREARTITVEVTPRDGQILALAQQAGVLSLTLRNGEAANPEEIEQITMDDVWGLAEDVEIIQTVEEAPVVRRIVINRGISPDTGQSE